MSPVSPCTTASQKTVIRLLMVEETFETRFFFLRAGDRIMPMSMETLVEIDHFSYHCLCGTKLNLDCDVGAG